jgi:hypothetical protein
LKVNSPHIFDNQKTNIQNDQGYDRQASHRAEKALGKQTTTIISSTELGNDCIFGVDDLEGSHVLDQGRFCFDLI